MVAVPSQAKYVGANPAEPYVKIDTQSRRRLVDDDHAFSLALRLDLRIDAGTTQRASFARPLRAIGAVQRMLAAATCRPEFIFEVLAHSPARVSIPPTNGDPTRWAI